jgi:hypothetical protein
MRPRSAAYPFCVLAAALALATAARAEVAPTCFPANNAIHVNPDTHLLLTFSSLPLLASPARFASTMPPAIIWSTHSTSVSPPVPTPPVASPPRLQR